MHQLSVHPIYCTTDLAIRPSIHTRSHGHDTPSMAFLIPAHPPPDLQHWQPDA
ncbi:hypothetical protein COCSADRAFT_298506 [Bipolaris sorokiniana ND90Pr]|uniref:Uncharacterized protein n=1 Tax=Cochliobolus sativus (strain ND90Pr / ATCC 201652) TaxID=665912 RepID=M2TCC3_COCSN|nr:uncharacterized protein COCSADRAFT_298506 [Bipolaris sorokiniana ND90Pr]EMD66467.1 hypothetical protein COCSADRAFT_298506 [Bipolaris sorokiniana ND90Pr]